MLFGAGPAKPSTLIIIFKPECSNPGPSILVVASVWFPCAAWCGEGSSEGSSEESSEESSSAGGYSK